MATNNPSIRGHQGTFKIYKDGALVDIVAVTSVSINQSTDFSQHFYVGKALPEGDSVVKGWTGTVDAEVKDALIDTFIDAVVTANLNGIGYSDYTFITTEYFPDGSTSSYAYFGLQWKIAREQKGMNDKITKKLEFQADGRIKL